MPPAWDALEHAGHRAEGVCWRARAHGGALRPRRRLGERRRGQWPRELAAPGCRWRFRVLSVTREEDRLAGDPLTELDAGQFPFQPRKPKFQPFVGESEVRDRLLAYRHKAAVRGGVLHVQPMTAEHVRTASELLADSFSEAVGYMPMYKGFLRRQVDEYLRSHLDIAPKAVVLVAILRPEAEGEWDDLDADVSGEGRRMTWFEQPAPAAAPPDAGGESGEAAAEARPPVTSVADMAQRSLDAADSQAEPDSPSVPEGAGSFAPETGRPATPEAGAALAPAPEQPQPQPEASLGVLTQASSPEPWQADSSSSSSSSSLGVEMSAAPALGDRLLPPPGELEAALAAAEAAEQAAGEIVGTVELSFAASTRTPAVTLNPPPDAAYLCNMAVGEAHQRRGFGLAILTAAEEVVRLAGFRRVYLHVRLKDEPAKGLYAKAEYGLEKEDCFFVALWDHRRRLLSKFIPQQPAAAEPPAAAARKGADLLPAEREF